MNISQERVVAVVIMHGNRWKFLSQMIPAVLKDDHIIKLIIVDNGSVNQKEIEEGTKEYGDRVCIIRAEKNLGSAGGFALGIAEAKMIDCDFVYLSDDDMVPEEGFVDAYLSVRRLLRDEKVIISGHRVDVPGNSDLFFEQTLKTVETNRTFFEVCSPAKVVNFFKVMFEHGKKKASGLLIPIVPTRGFVYGGAFIPHRAIVEAPLPDASLFLYGDDIVYSWGIEDIGYTCYAATIPVIHDIDITFAGSHIHGLFEANVAPWKVYYRIRNMVRISRKYSKQGGVGLFFSVFFWILGLFVIGLSRQGLSKQYYRRIALIIEAVRAGYDEKRSIPREAEI